MSDSLAINPDKSSPSWRRLPWGTAAAFVVLTLVSLTTVVPFLFMFSTSFTSASTMMSYPPKLIPSTGATLDNYRTLLFDFQGGLFGRWFLNSIFVTTVTTVASVLLNTLAGYVFAKKQFIGKELVFVLILSTMMVPPAVKLIPSFQIARFLNIYNTYWALILPALATPIGIFMMRQFIRAIPGELIEAARLEGAGELRVFFEHILPLSKPGMAALAILTAVNVWNDFLWPLVVLPSPTLRTLTVGLATIQGQFNVDYGLVMAGSVVTIVPMLIVYFVFQRQFVEGLSAGFTR